MGVIVKKIKKFEFDKLLDIKLIDRFPLTEYQFKVLESKIPDSLLENRDFSRRLAAGVEVALSRYDLFAPIKIAPGKTKSELRRLIKAAINLQNTIDDVDGSVVLQVDAVAFPLNDRLSRFGRYSVNYYHSLIADGFSEEACAIAEKIGKGVPAVNSLTSVLWAILDDFLTTAEWSESHIESSENTRPGRLNSERLVRLLLWHIQCQTDWQPTASDWFFELVAEVGKFRDLEGIGKTLIKKAIKEQAARFTRKGDREA